MEALIRIEEWKIVNDTTRILDLKNLNLEELPLLPNNLEKLDCSNNYLISLINLPASLKFLNCSNNNLKLELLSENELKRILPAGIQRIFY